MKFDDFEKTVAYNCPYLGPKCGAKSSRVYEADAKTSKQLVIPFDAVQHP